LPKNHNWKGGDNVKYALFTLVALTCILLANQVVLAGCKNLDAPAINVAFNEEVKAEKGAVYLSFFGGSTPKPNDCGLNPTNPIGEWTGWGGPLNFDNASIGEGGGTRNFITIAGVRYERGIGTHAVAKLVYDLTGKSYKRFMGVAGMDDEKGNDGCGHGGSSQFVFSIDGEEVFDTGVLKGSDPDGKEVEFAIPSGAKELTIDIRDAGDGVGCDHADIGAARLLTTGAAVTPGGKLATAWGDLKSKF